MYPTLEDESSMSPSDLEAIRAVIREEIEPMHSDMRAGFERVWAEFKELRDHLDGVVDERFPPIDKARRQGGRALGGTGMAAKTR